MNLTCARAALVCLAAFLFQGCASIVSGTTQVVSVDTPGCVAASCELANDKGKWYISATPGTTSVSRAFAPMTVTCKLSDVTGSGVFNSSTKAMAFGNILFGGVIGAGVDIASGAAYDYPPMMSVPMVCAPKTAQGATTVAAAAGRGPRLGIKVENISPAVATATGTTEGVLVTEVDPAGLAMSMGMKVGQILVEMNGRRITNYEGLASELVKASDTGVEFLVLEGGQRYRLASNKAAL